MSGKNNEKKNPISVAMKPHQILRNIWVHPKNKGEPKERVYTIDCKNCSKTYVGETKTFGTKN